MLDCGTSSALMKRGSRLWAVRTRVVFFLSSLPVPPHTAYRTKCRVAEAAYQGEDSRDCDHHSDHANCHLHSLASGTLARHRVGWLTGVLLAVIFWQAAGWWSIHWGDLQRLRFRYRTVAMPSKPLGWIGTVQILDGVWSRYANVGSLVKSYSRALRHSVSGRRYRSMCS
jgi:hypothetical protein